MNLSKCRRCKADVVASGPHVTNRRFCSRDCYDTWWNEQRSRGITRGAVATHVWGQVSKRRLTETQRAWLAALIDGEGTVGIWRERRRGNTSGWRYHPAVQVTNTNKALLDEAQSCLQGWAHWKNKRRQSPRHKPSYAVTVRGRAVRVPLQQIKKYLVAKRRQAEVVLEFCRVMEAAPMRTSLVHDIFEALYRECKALNRRGVS